MPLMSMSSIEQKFSAFVNSLSPDEQRAAAPLMQIFSQTMAGPQPGSQGPDVPNAPPPPGAKPAPPAVPPPTAIPGGPPIPPPVPDPAMSIGRQMY